jgi:hypothetical protein
MAIVPNPSQVKVDSLGELTWRGRRLRNLPCSSVSWMAAAFAMFVIFRIIACRAVWIDFRQHFPNV